MVAATFALLALVASVHCATTTATTTITNPGANALDGDRWEPRRNYTNHRRVDGRFMYWGCERELKLTIRPLDSNFSQCAVAVTDHTEGANCTRYSQYSTNPSLDELFTLFLVPLPAPSPATAPGNSSEVGEQVEQEEAVGPCPYVAASIAIVGENNTVEPLDSALRTLKAECGR